MCSWPTETWRKPGNHRTLTLKPSKRWITNLLDCDAKQGMANPRKPNTDTTVLCPGTSLALQSIRIWINNDKHGIKVSCCLSDLEWRYTHVIHCCQVTCGCRRHKNLASALAASKSCYVVSEEITGLRVCVYLSYVPIANQGPRMRN